MIEVLKDRMIDSEEGFTTAELLGNAALGVAALAVLWALMGTLGGDMVAYIKKTMKIT